MSWKSELPLKSTAAEKPVKRESSQQESYYLTNEVGNYEELSQAVRLHWQVETNNHLRDVSLKEDQMRSKKRNSSKRWEKSERWQP